MGVPVYQVNIGKFPGIKDIQTVKEVIKAGNFDIIHTHLIHGDLYGAIVKKWLLPSMRLVSTKHGYEEWYNNAYGFDPAYRKKNLYWRICRFSEKQVNASFAISDGLRRFFVESGISSDTKLSRIHYGFDMSDHKTQAPVGRVGNPQFVLAGRLVGFKGHRYALEAMKKLTVTYPKAHLWILGIGELEKELKNKVNELGLDKNVDFMGFKENVGAYMQASDVVMIPSIAEGFGVVYLEAIQSSKRIAAFNVPAGNEILDHRYHKLLAQPFDIDEMVENIEWMLSNEKDMEQLLVANRERLLQYFTIDRMVAEIKDFYQTVMRRA